MDIARILSHSDFFRDVGATNLKALAEISIPKKVHRKQTLFLEGDRGHSMYLLVYGTIQLSKSAPDGRDVVIKILGPGEIFAEVVLFEQDHYPVSAVALEESLVLMIPRRQVHCLLADERFRIDFITILMKKQRLLADRIRVLALHDVEDRFFFFLEEQYGCKEHYTVKLSKKDIAAAIGTNPETLSRLLHRLKQEGVLSWTDKKLSLRSGFWKERRK
jgi:CRP-like cAMP-binding protein